MNRMKVRGISSDGAASPVGLPAAKSEKPRRRLSAMSRREQVEGYLFVAPQIVGVLLVVVIPVILALYFSLHSWNVFSGDFEFIGGENFRRVFNDPEIPNVLRATLIFSLGVVVINMALGLTLAVMLNGKLRGGTALRTIFFSPVVISVVAWTLVWGFLLQDNGIVNEMLSMIGIQGPNWLRTGPTAMLSVIIVQVFRSVGTNMILFLAALQGVPEEIYEAAKLDGASRFATFFRITIPMISPMMLLTSILTIVGALQSFAIIDVLTEGGPGRSTTVLVHYLYQQAFQYADIGYGSALALMLLTFVMVLTVVQWQMRTKWVHFEQ